MERPSRIASLAIAALRSSGKRRLRTLVAEVVVVVVMSIFLSARPVRFG
jgi:hypothetical protein